METSDPTPDQSDPSENQRCLDEFFDRAVGALQLGEPIPFPEELKSNPALAAAAERLADVARALCSSAAPSLDLRGYTILSELGRGGMGVVYLAKQERLGGRPVAIKILPPHIAGSLSARARFKSEVMSVARQRHAGIVSVYDIVEDGETLAYVMEWVDGVTLQQIIDAVVDRGAQVDRLDVARELLGTPLVDETYWAFAARVGASIARALGAVHASGVLHRDVKPSNILVRRDGTPLLSDFGLAKDTSRDSLTVGPGFVGTLAYASPEQLRGEEIDPRSDVYSLGATLLHLLLLAPPVRDPGVPGVLAAIRQGEHLAGLRAAGEIPRPLRDIVERAMSFDREDRYANAGEMGKDLDAFVSGGVPIRRGRLQVISRAAPGFAVAVALIACGFGILSGVRSWLRLRDAGPLGLPTRLTLENPQPGDEFGHAVSGFGERLLIGSAHGDAPGADAGGWDAGRAAIFVRREGTWELEAELEAPGLRRGSMLGECVILGEDLALVGAPGVEMDGTSRAGAVYVFRLEGGVWTFLQRVGAPVPFEGDEFGFRARRSGDIVVVTSYFRSSQAGREGPSAMPKGTGPAHVFRVGPSGLTHLQTLYPESLRSPDVPGMFPEVIEGGEYIVLGAPFANTAAGEQSGAVFVYAREPGLDRWSFVRELTAPGTKPFDNFGTQVVAFRMPGEIEGAGGVHLAVSAATWAYPESARVGKVCVFGPQKDDGGRFTWELDSEISPPERTREALFGLSLRALDGKLAIFHKVPREDGGLNCRIGMYERGADGTWVLETDLAQGDQVEDDLGLGMDLWHADGASGAWYLGAGAAKLDWPTVGEGPGRDRGVVWVWRGNGRE